MATATTSEARAAADYPTRMYIDGRGATRGRPDAGGHQSGRRVGGGRSGLRTRDEAERAIDAAAGRFRRGGPSSVYDRAKILKKTAELMRDARAEIARH